MTRKKIIFVALLVSIGLWTLGMQQITMAQYSGSSEIRIQVIGDSSDVDVEGETNIEGPVDTTKPESGHPSLPDTNTWLPGLGDSGLWLMWIGFAILGFGSGELFSKKIIGEEV